jgi:hypothetical protein
MGVFVFLESFAWSIFSTSIFKIHVLPQRKHLNNVLKQINSLFPLTIHPPHQPLKTQSHIRNTCED